METLLLARTKSGKQICIIPKNMGYYASTGSSEMRITKSSFQSKNEVLYLMLNKYQVKSLLGINVGGDAYIEIVTKDSEAIVKEQYSLWAEEYRNALINFKNEVIEGKIRVKIAIVGSDFPQAVLSMREDYMGIKAFDALYSLGEDVYNAYRWLPNELQVDGLDVTERVSERLKEKLKEESAHDEKVANIAAGCIYFHCENAPHEEDLSSLVLNQPAPNAGSYTLEHRISDDLFARVKKFARYYSAEFLEDCDMFESNPGWRFSRGAIEELLKTNRVFVDNIEVSKI